MKHIRKLTEQSDYDLANQFNVGDWFIQIHEFFKKRHKTYHKPYNKGGWGLTNDNFRIYTLENDDDVVYSISIDGEISHIFPEADKNLFPDETKCSLEFDKNDREEVVITQVSIQTTFDVVAKNSPFGSVISFQDDLELDLTPKKNTLDSLQEFNAFIQAFLKLDPEYFDKNRGSSYTR